MSNKTIQEFTIAGYVGKWYMIEHNEVFALMESCTYGDEASAVIVYYDDVINNLSNNHIDVNFGETYDDLQGGMYDNDLLQEYYHETDGTPYGNMCHYDLFDGAGIID